MVIGVHLSIKGDRLDQTLTQLAEIGKLPHGGVKRLAYSPEDIQAREYIQTLMQDAGMKVHIDAAGNLVGTYPGINPRLPALATGSHLDTVPTGGRYDGAYGVLAGIEIVKVLSEHHIRLNHSLQVIAFTDEEGGMIGSKAMLGLMPPLSYPTPDGSAIETCLQRLGGNWKHLASAKRTRQDIAAFVELHVEQGGILEAQNQQIGIVTGIVGQRRYTVTILGQANHAGTTPMSLRKDALIAAAKLILAVQSLAIGDSVATVGYLQVSPNAPNVVPGCVNLSVDLRDLDLEKLEGMVVALHNSGREIASFTETEIQITPILQVQPTLAVETVQTAIAQACQQLNLTYRFLPSRASHDAQEIGRFTDMGMIFVPSQGGISHAETEYTSPEQCTQGANVLLQTLLTLDSLY